MAHGKLQMIKVQMYPHPLEPFSWLYLISAAEYATELLNQHENILVIPASPLPLKDKHSLKSADCFHPQKYRE